MTTPSTQVPEGPGAIPFAGLLEMIEDRSAALREAVARVPGHAPVPDCPGWSVRDLVAHLGEVHRFWAATVAAGPGQPPLEDEQIPDRAPGPDLLAWSADATSALLGALREAGPGRGCWTWWSRSGAAADSGAVARHQVQEAAVHAWDGQRAAGRATPLPTSISLDGVEEFLTVVLGAAGAWPGQAGRVAVRAEEGGCWLVDLGAAGARVHRDRGGAGGGEEAGSVSATVRAAASDLVLFLYGRRPGRPVAVEGDRELVGRLLAWAPTD